MEEAAFSIFFRNFEICECTVLVHDAQKYNKELIRMRNGNFEILRARGFGA